MLHCLFNLRSIVKPNRCIVIYLFLPSFIHSFIHLYDGAAEFHPSEEDPVEGAVPTMDEVEHPLSDTW